MAERRPQKKSEKTAKNGHSRGVAATARQPEELSLGMDAHAEKVVRVILSAAARGKLTDAEAALLDDAFERSAGDFMRSAAGPDPVPDTFGRAVQRAMTTLSPRPRKRRSPAAR